MSFAPGETRKTVAVLVKGDRLGEADESFVLNLTTPTGVVIADGQGKATILDDEPRIHVTAPVAVPEGNKKTEVHFAVNLSVPSSQTLTVDYATADGTAKAPKDYHSAEGMLACLAMLASGGRMFLRRYTRTKGGKRHVYFALGERVRTEAGPRQRVVAHLGELNHDQERRWQRTVVFHNQHGEAQELRLFLDDDTPGPDDPNVARIRLDSVGWTNGRRFGDVWLARQLWQLLELDQIVARQLPQSQETIPPADIVALEVINRLCQPCSEFALAEHWSASTGLEDLLGVPDAAVTKDRL